MPTSGVANSRYLGLMISCAVHMLLFVALATMAIVSLGPSPMWEISASSASPESVAVLLSAPEPPSQSVSSASADPHFADPHFADHLQLGSRGPILVSPSLQDSFWSQRFSEINRVGSLSREQRVSPTDSPVSAQFFGLDGHGKRIVYLVDCSGSMWGHRWNAAREELIRSIRALDEDITFLVIFFSDRSFPMPGGAMVLATPENVDLVAQWIESKPIGGGTKPLEAVVAAHSQEPDVVFLLTDGEFSDGTARFLRDNNSVLRDEMASVHTIAFHSRAGLRLLKRIANENSGQFRFVPFGG
jgi:hypothetical protein